VTAIGKYLKYSRTGNAVYGKSQSKYILLTTWRISLTSTTVVFTVTAGPYATTSLQQGF